MTILLRVIFFLLWPLAWWLRRRVIRRVAAEHDAYAHDRVYNRNRPGFHPDQREMAILQRAQRQLHKTRIQVNARHVQKILEKS